MKYKSSGISHAEAVLAQRKEAYLKANGWVHTSDTPGSLWLWKKEDTFGSTFYVDTLSAVRIQIASEK